MVGIVAGTKVVVLLLLYIYFFVVPRRKNSDGRKDVRNHTVGRGSEILAEPSYV